jgi:hypothetical protein
MSLVADDPAEEALPKAEPTLDRAEAAAAPDLTIAKSCVFTLAKSLLIERS